jgi:transcriptional regulator with XRE-family HTH domain
MAGGQKGAGQGAGSKDQDALVAFAEELKAWRAARGWTQGDLGAAVNYSESMIAQVEACFKPATMQLAEALDRVFGTPGYARAESGALGTPGTFMRLAKRIRMMSFPVAFRPFTGFDEEATTLMIFEHSFLPGLFQTEAYARAVLLTHPHATDEQVEQRLSARLSRQPILAGDNPPHVWVIISEPVLHVLVGSAETMHGQLINMIGLSRLPNVTVQILPTTQHAAIQGSFHLAEVQGTSTAAFIADATDGRTTQDPATLNALSARFRYLQSEAMSPSASRERMEKVAKETWSET